MSYASREVIFPGVLNLSVQIIISRRPFVRSFGSSVIVFRLYRDIFSQVHVA